VTEELVEALWVGSHPAELADRRTLQSGVDTALIGRREAETSDNWQIVDPPKPEAPKTAAKPAAPAKAGD
jgi:hypothetical protein